MLAGVYGTANISYAGGKNSTFIDGISTNRNTPAVVNYFNSGVLRLPHVISQECCRTCTTCDRRAADRVSFLSPAPAGNGTLIFTGNVDANGVTPPPAGCVNITGFSQKECNDSAIIPVPKYPQFPPKRPRCRGGSWILRGAVCLLTSGCAALVLHCCDYEGVGHWQTCLQLTATDVPA